MKHEINIFRTPCCGGSTCTVVQFEQNNLTMTFLKKNYITYEMEYRIDGKMCRDGAPCFISYNKDGSVDFKRFISTNSLQR